MRVLHLADYGGPYPGSFVPMLRASAAEARERGWTTEAVLHPIARGRPWLPELAEAGIPHSFAPEAGRGELTGWVEERLREGDGRPTVLHTHYTTYDLPAAAAARRRPGTAVFWHVHSFARPQLRIRLRNAVKFGVWGRRVDGILCVTPEIAGALRGRLAPGERVVEFPNAIDAARFPLVTGERRASARGRLGIPPDARVLLHFAWDWEVKGGDLFLEAVRRLHLPGVVALTVGGGAAARAKVAELGLEDCVRVLDATPEVTGLYAAADVFVACSRREGMPFAMAEALASGLGVAASDIPGQARIGVGLAACRLARLEPAPLADAIGDLLARDPAVAAADGRAARARIEETLDLGGWAARLADLHAAALARHARSPA